MAPDIYEALAAELRQLSGAANVAVGPDGRTVRVRPHPPLAGAPDVELAGILRLAGRYGVGVSTAGDLPEGISLRLDRWHRVVAVDRERLCLTVQPEAPTARVLDKLAGEGLGLPPDPCLKPVLRAGREVIGGYAAARRLLGLEAVLPDGCPVRLGGADGAGQLEQGLARLIMAAGGALGVVTCLYLRMGYRAPVSALLLASFARMEEARSVFFALGGRPETAGASLECLDFSLLAGGPVCDHLLPFAGCGGMLILEFSGPGPEAVEESYVRAGSFCREAGALEVLAADNPAARQRVKKIREYYLAGVGGPLVHLSGPVRSEWPDQARAGGLTVPYCRLEGATLCLGLGGAGEGLSRFLAGLQQADGRDEAVLAVLARIGKVLDPGRVLAAAGGIIQG